MGWLVIILIVAVAYGYSVWRRPNRVCPVCKGDNRNRDQVWTGAFGNRNCWRCKDRGYLPRLGTRILAPGVYRSIKAGKHGRNH